MSKKKDPPALVARFPNTEEGRALLSAFRSCVNRARYKVRVLTSGPRKRGTYRPRKEDVKSFRLYLDDRNFSYGSSFIKRMREAEEVARTLRANLKMYQEKELNCFNKLNELVR